MGWLLGWDKRKSHLINGAAGAGTNYKVRIKTYYDNDDIFEFKENINWAGDPDAYDGVTFDGGGFVFTYGGGGANGNIRRFNMSTHAKTHESGAVEGGGYTDGGSICYYNGEIYITVGTYAPFGGIGKIRVYDASDLSYEREYIIDGDIPANSTISAIAYYDGFFWVTVDHQTNVAKVFKYNTSFVLQDSFDLAYVRAQGIAWIDDFCYVNSQQIGGNHLVKYDNTFTEVGNQSSTWGGIGFDPDTGYLWMSSGNHDPPDVIVNYVHNVSLEGNCKTDFGDVRFTDDDGVTELEYYMLTKVDSDYAIFFVTVKDDLSSNQTIYIYYGKTDATTTSSGPEDFSDTDNWIEEDPNTRITKTATRVTHTNVIRNESAYLYKDEGAGYFDGDFEFLVDIEITDSSGGDKDRGSLWAVGMNIGDLLNLGKCIALNFDNDVGGEGTGIKIYEYDGASWHSAWWTGFEKNQTYYCKITRIGATITCEVYSDVARTSPNLLDTITFTLQAVENYRYLYGFLSMTSASGASENSSGYSENLFKRITVSPEPVHGAWGSEESPEWISDWRYRKKLNISGLPTSYPDKIEDLGVIIDHTDLGIGNIEDCVVIKGHDNNYYAFITEYAGGGVYNRIHYAKSSSPEFPSLDDTGTAWNQAGVRVMAMVHDAGASKYYMIYSDVTNSDIRSVETTEANFPTGWGSVVTLIPKGAGGEWDDEAVQGGSLFQYGSTFYLFYNARANPAAPFECKIGCASGSSLRALMTKDPNNPLLTPTGWANSYSGSRGARCLQFGDVGYILAEGRKNTKWYNGLFKVTGLSEGAGSITVTQEDNAVMGRYNIYCANPYFLNDGGFGEINAGSEPYYVYFQMQESGAWTRINVGKIRFSGYQIKIVVHYGAGADSGEDVYLNGKCKTDFSDIRFTRSDGTTLEDYWLEEKTDSDNAVFWVEVTDTYAIYIYYGNSGASSVSNGEDTWDRFYDPENDATGGDPSADIISEPSGTSISVETEQAKFGTKSVKINDESGVNGCWTAHSPAHVALRVLRWIYFTDPATTESFGLEINDSGTSDAVYVWANIPTLGAGKLGYFDGAWHEICSITENVWNRIEIVSVAANDDFNIKVNATWYNNLNLRGNPILYDTVRSPTGSSSTPLWYYDIIAVGKYSEPEPSLDSWGSEEMLALFPSGGAVAKLMELMGML